MDISCSQPYTQSQGKSVKTRRSWTQMEENCLAVAFKEAIQQGWRTENGFRNGYLHILEQKLQAVLPGTDLRADPHIHSKYNTWKKNYKDVKECLGNSGFNWCSGTKRVVAPSHVWDEYIRAHPGLGHVRKSCWPLYEAWGEIFGEDIARGGLGVDYNANIPAGMQAPQPHIAPPREVPGNPNLINNQPTAFTGLPNGHNVTTPNLGSPSSNNAYHSPPPPVIEDAQGTAQFENGSPDTERAFQSDTDSLPANRRAGADNRKRKRGDSVQDLAEVMERMWGKATDSMDRMSARMGHEIDDRLNRKRLFQQITSLPLIVSSADQLQGALAIAHDQETMDVFYGLPEEEKCDVVRLALQGLNFGK